MSLLRREWRVFCTAVMFFTRLPVPAWPDYDQEWLQAAPRYFPLVGVLVGGIGAGVWWLAAQILPGEIAVLLSMIATLVVTGAFHEDGFADVCDGFGGGWTRPQVLAIMKDSRVGAFGAIGIALMLGLKAVTLARVPAGLMVATLVAGHAASRWASATLMATLAYVRDEDDAKARPMATPLGAGSLAVATLFGLAPLLLLPVRTWWALGPVGLARWWLGRWFLRRIGGYTGDCLGAAQQVAEVVFYLAVVALTWR